jgi:hypothetical protein
MISPSSKKLQLAASRYKLTPRVLVGTTSSFRTKYLNSFVGQSRNLTLNPFHLTYHSAAHKGLFFSSGTDNGCSIVIHGVTRDIPILASAVAIREEVLEFLRRPDGEAIAFGEFA